MACLYIFLLVGTRRLSDYRTFGIPSKLNILQHSSYLQCLSLVLLELIDQIAEGKLAKGVNLLIGISAVFE